MTRLRPEARSRRATAAAALLLVLALGGPRATAAPQARAGLFFDDFSQPDTEALRASGWILRSTAGHPGVPGARWAPEGIQLLADPERPGNRLLRLEAQTDGRADGTQQAQLCQARKFLRGTYAARVRFSDVPVQGADGDPVVQAFYAIGPLAHDLDPQFSEVDFEYLPNGGWGSERTRLYGIAWHTVQIEPWRAFNQPHEAFGSHAGWHVLTIQVSDTQVRHFVDGRLLGRSGGRNVPELPMAIQFSLWFSPTGLLPAGGATRRYQMDVDWVLHQSDRLLPPQELPRLVQRLRRAGVLRHDAVAAPQPPLASACNL